MGFYGNIGSNQTPFTFDTIYSSKYRMDDMATTDNILMGRCVLIDYNYNDAYEGTGKFKVPREIKEGKFFTPDPARKYQESNSDEAQYHYIEDFQEGKFKDDTKTTWDQTVWQKAYVKTTEGMKIQYILLARLNPTIPEISLDQESHIKVNDNLNSITILPSSISKDKKASSPLNIHYTVTKPWDFELTTLEYNESGFNKDIHHYEDPTQYDDRWTSNGESMNGKITVDYEEKENQDVAKISVILPALGNSVCELYDTLYGEDRKDQIVWNDPASPLTLDNYQNFHSALSLTENGRMEWDGSECTTLAGNINTANHLLGMLIHVLSKEEYNKLYENSTDIDASKLYSGWIYYNPLTKKFYRRKDLDIFEELTDCYEFSDIALTADTYMPFMYYYKVNDTYVPATDNQWDSTKEYAVRTLTLTNDDLYQQIPSIYTDYKPNKYYYRDPNNEDGFILSGTDKPSINRDYVSIDIIPNNDFDQSYKAYRYHKKLSVSPDSVYYNYSLLGDMDDYNEYMQSDEQDKSVQILVDDLLTGANRFYEKGKFYWTKGEDSDEEIPGIQYFWRPNPDDGDDADPNYIYGSPGKPIDLLDANGNYVYADGKRQQYTPINLIGKIRKKETGKIYTKEYICDEYTITNTNLVQPSNRVILKSFFGHAGTVDLTQSHYPIVLKKCIAPTKEMWESDYSIFFVFDGIHNNFSQEYKWSDLENHGIQFYALALKDLKDDLSNWRECEMLSCDYYVVTDPNDPYDDNTHKYYYLIWETVSEDSDIPKDIINNTYTSNTFYYDAADTENKISDYPTYLVKDTSELLTPDRKYYLLSNITPKVFIDPDQHYYKKSGNNFVLATPDQDGFYGNEPLYIQSLVYVLNDIAGFYNNYSIYPYVSSSNTPVPSSISLAKKSSKSTLVELSSFGKELSTINGLILELSRILNNGDHISRDTSTIQGALNRFNDLTTQFNEIKPNNIMVVNSFGRIQDATFDDWFNLNTKYVDGRIQATLQHADPINNADTQTTNMDMNNTNLQFGSTVRIPTITYDSKGHIFDTGKETFTLPKNSLDTASANPDDGKLVIGLTLDDSTGKFGTNRAAAGTLVLGDEYTVATNGKIKKTDKLNDAFNNLDSRLLNTENLVGTIAVATQIANAIGELDVKDTADNTKFVSAISETDGKISVSRAAAGTLEVAGTKGAGNETLNSIKDRVDILTAGATTAGSVAYQIAQVVANADTRFDTLKEIADWIVNDTAGVATINSNLATLNSASHTHDNKTILDGITSTQIAKWNAAQPNDKDTVLTTTTFTSGNVTKTIAQLLDYVIELEARIAALESPVEE